MNSSIMKTLIVTGDSSIIMNVSNNLKTSLDGKLAHLIARFKKGGSTFQRYQVFACSGDLNRQVDNHANRALRVSEGIPRKRGEFFSKLSPRVVDFVIICMLACSKRFRMHVSFHQRRCIVYRWRWDVVCIILMTSLHMPLLTYCWNFETMGNLMQEEGGIMDYEEGQQRTFVAIITSLIVLSSKPFQ
jgi:hypothetical protein